jgi:RNA polymerase sigma-70 factor (ECF subfamily)
MAHGLDPERASDAEQRRRLVQQSIEQLPPKQRTAIVLRDIEGLSTAEVAEALGSTEATVRSHIASARVKLKGMLSVLLRGRS